MKNKRISKIFSVALVLTAIFSLAKFVSASPKSSNKSLPSSPEVLKKEAQNCLQNKDYVRARQIYRKIITEWPKTDLAFEAQKNLVILAIVTGSDESPLVIGKFFANCADHPELKLTFWDIAFRCIGQEKIDSMIKLGQNFLIKHPSDPNAIWAQFGLAMCYILQNKDVKAQSAIEKLLADFSNHSDAAQAIIKIANMYRRSKTDRAIELYQRVLTEHPSDPHAIWAQSGLAMCYILQNEDVKAKAAIERLLIDFSNHPDVAQATIKIANEYRRSKTDRAIELYQRVLTKHPSDPHAIWAQSGLAMCYILQNEDVKAQAAVEKVWANFSSHSDVAQAINRIANWCRRSKTDRAIELYQRVLTEHLSDPHAIWAQSGLATCYILQSEDAKAEATVEKVLANFSNHPGIAKAIIRIANKYRRSKTDRAIELYQRVLTKYPSDPHAIWAQSSLAMCYIWQHEDAKAEAAIEKVLADFPNHPDTARAITHIANWYRRRKTHRAIELYQRVLTEHLPDPYAIWAQSGLAMCYILQNEGAKAEVAVKKLLVDFSRHPDIAEAMAKTIQEYRRVGRINIINQKYVLDNWISSDMPLQSQKTGLLFCIEFCDNKTAYDGLEKFMDRLAKYPDSADIVNEIGSRCHELKKHEMAVKLYQDYFSRYAIESDKKEIELKLYESMYLAGINPEKVLLCLDNYVVENKGGHISLVADAIALRGRIFMKLAEADKAINEFLALVTEYPETKHAPEAGFFIGYCYILQGKFDQAKETLNLVVKNYPQSSFAGEAKLYLTRIESMTE